MMSIRPTTSPLRAHAEDAARLSARADVRGVIAPMFHITGACDCPGSFEWYPFNGSPREQGERLRAGVLTLPMADRWVNIMWLTKPTLLWLESLPGGIAKVLAGELPKQPSVWPEVVNLTMARRAFGMRPTAIYTDTEYGWSTWGLGDEGTRSLLDDRAVKRAMPAALAAIDPGAMLDWIGEPSKRALVSGFNQWAEQVVNRITRMILEVSGWTRAGFLRPAIPVVDAFTLGSPRFPVADRNAWPLGATAPSPAWRNNSQLYLERGSLDGFLGLKKHAVWNALIREINIARAAPGVHTICWPGMLGFEKSAGEWIFDRLIGHIARAGNREFSYFNAGAVEADDLVVAGTLARHSRSRVVANLPAVPFDADAIVSGDYLTTYAEFTAAFGVLL